MSAPHLAWHLAWQKGGSARIVALSDDAVTLSSTVPAPPGARLEATLLVEPEVNVRVKSHGSKREEDGTFTLNGRLLDASRMLRDRLAALAAAGAGFDSP
jgi:hypothetical protein